MYIKKKETLPAYISKRYSTCEKHIILLMIPNEEKEGWHHLAVENISALLHRKTSKNKNDFYCLNCLHSSRTENNLNLMKKYIKINISVELQYQKKRKKNIRT